MDKFGISSAIRPNILQPTSDPRVYSRFNKGLMPNAAMRDQELLQQIQPEMAHPVSTYYNPYLSPQQPDSGIPYSDRISGPSVNMEQGQPIEGLSVEDIIRLERGEVIQPDDDMGKFKKIRDLLMQKEMNR